MKILDTTRIRLLNYRRLKPFFLTLKGEISFDFVKFQIDSSSAIPLAFYAKYMIT